MASNLLLRETTQEWFGFFLWGLNSGQHFLPNNLFGLNNTSPMIYWDWNMGANMWSRKIARFSFVSPEWTTRWASCVWWPRSCTPGAEVCCSRPPDTCCRRHRWLGSALPAGAAGSWCSRRSAGKQSRWTSNLCLQAELARASQVLFSRTWAKWPMKLDNADFLWIGHAENQRVFQEEFLNTISLKFFKIGFSCSQTYGWA